MKRGGYAWCTAQMAAQIKRIDRALDDGCRPISLTLSEIRFGLVAFVDVAITTMQSMEPETIARLVELSKVMVSVSKDGTTASSTRRGTVVWDAATARTNNLLRVESNNVGRFESAAGTAVASLFVMTLTSQPHTCEIPQAIAKYFQADPASPLAHRYRLFVRHSLLPSMRRVTRLIEKHAALIELPPIAWLKTAFPQEETHSMPPSLFFFFWTIRAQQWEAVLADWDDTGDFGSILPPQCGLPYGGLQQVINWSTERAEGRQRELVGITTEFDRSNDDWSEYARRVS
eukprot:SAG31_NODE_1698_length_7500_cov_3.644778_6_plen_288_part_00